MLLWRNIALVLAVAVITLGVVAAQQARSARQTENELAARYQHAFFESLGHTENVEVLLAKGVAASGPTQIAELFTALSASAYAAQSSLTSLPLMHGSTIETGKFLTQVADFGAMIARKAAAGIPPSEEEMTVLRSMRREVALLNDSLHRIYQDVAQGQMPWSEIQRRA